MPRPLQSRGRPGSGKPHPILPPHPIIRSHLALSSKTQPSFFALVGRGLGGVWAGSRLLDT